MVQPWLLPRDLLHLYAGPKRAGRETAESGKVSHLSQPEFTSNKALEKSFKITRNSQGKAQNNIYNQLLDALLHKKKPSKNPTKTKPLQSDKIRQSGFLVMYYRESKKAHPQQVPPAQRTAQIHIWRRPLPAYSLKWATLVYLTRIIIPTFLFFSSLICEMRTTCNNS